MRRQITWTLFGCAFIIWAGTQSWAWQGDTSKPVGLTGILAAYAPEGLTEDDFTALNESIDDTWKSWVTETGKLVKDFYEGDHPTIESQQAAIQSLQVKLKTMEKALQDRRYTSIHDEIGELYQRLSPQVDMADALLETLTADPEAALKARVAASNGALKATLQELRGEMGRIKGGSAWLTWTNADALQKFDPTNQEAITDLNAVKDKLAKRESYSDEIKKFISRPIFLKLEDNIAAIQTAIAEHKPVDEAQLRESMIDLLDAISEYRSEVSADNLKAVKAAFGTVLNSAPDGGVAIGDVYAKYFQNFNLRIAVSEGFMNRISGEARRQNSRINQNAMGAYIVGNQTSDVNVGVDVQPSNKGARFDITLSGVISTNTNAYAGEATIHTVGRHSVSATKPVTFDGTNFSTQPARISVYANNQPVGASTRYSGGLFGGIAQNIAMREANARRGEANAYTQRSIQQELSAELNKEVDSRFANASMELQNKFYGPLREFGLYPDLMELSSTSQFIHINTRLSNEDEIGGSLANLGIEPPSNGMLAQVHESLLTNSTNRLDLGTENKKEMTEGELRELIKERLSKILDREIKLGDADSEDSGNVFVFDQPNPIRFSIQNGEVEIRIRAGLKREGDNIPTQIITVPLIPTVNGDKVLLSRGNVGVKPVERPSSVAEQVARANVMRQKIQSALPEKELDASFVVEQDNKKINLKISAIKAENGWLSISLE